MFSVSKDVFAQIFSEKQISDRALDIEHEGLKEITRRLSPTHNIPS